jgi:hypothetical protein
MQLGDSLTIVGRSCSIFAVAIGTEWAVSSVG